MLRLDTWQSRMVFGAGLLLVGGFLLLPLAWMVLTSFKPEQELFVRMPLWLPQAPTLEHYAQMLARGDMALQLRNSLITALSGAVLTVALAVYAAYGFAKFRFRGRKPLMLLISVYPMLQALGLLNTHLGLVLSYIILALPSGTYMLYSYFVNVPSEIIEAARADGAGELYILHRIVLPLAMPALVTVGLYAFMWAWNDLLFSLTLVTEPQLRTVGPGLMLGYLGEGRSDWGGAMAASIISSLPVVVGFAFLQRFFIQGLTAGAVKS